MGEFGAGLVQGYQGVQQLRNQRDQLETQKKYAEAQMKVMDLDTKIKQQQFDQLMNNKTLFQRMMEPGTQSVEEFGPTGRMPITGEQQGPGAPQPSSLLATNMPPPAAGEPDPFKSLRGPINIEGPRPQGISGYQESPARRTATAQTPSLLEQSLAGFSPQARSFLLMASQLGGPQIAQTVMTKMLERELAPEQFGEAAPGATVYSKRNARPVFQVPNKPERPVPVAPGGRLVDPITGEEVFAAPPKETSPVNPVDQYIFATSGGKYPNMAAAAAAGETALIQEAEKVVREARPLERAIAVGGAKQELAKKDTLSVEDANKLGVPYGTTKEGAAGLTPLTAQQRESMSGFAKARTLIADIQKYSEKVNTFEAGMGNRLIEGGKNVVGSITQTNESAALLRSKAGELAQLARSMGEKGAMAEGDIQRAANLIPSLTDSKGVAKAKLADLVKLIDEAEKAFNESLKPVPAQPSTKPKTSDKPHKNPKVETVIQGLMSQGMTRQQAEQVLIDRAKGVKRGQ